MEANHGRLFSPMLVAAMFRMYPRGIQPGFWVAAGIAFRNLAGFLPPTTAS